MISEDYFNTGNFDYGVKPLTSKLKHVKLQTIQLKLVAISTSVFVRVRFSLFLPLLLVGIESGCAVNFYLVSAQQIIL